MSGCLPLMRLCLCMCLRAFLSVALSFIFNPTITGGPKHGVRGCENRDRVSVCRPPARRCAHTLVCAFVYGCARLYACKLYTYICMARKICYGAQNLCMCVTTCMMNAYSYKNPHILIQTSWVGTCTWKQILIHVLSLAHTNTHTHIHTHTHTHRYEYPHINKPDVEKFASEVEKTCKGAICLLLHALLINY